MRRVPLVLLTVSTAAAGGFAAVAVAADPPPFTPEPTTTTTPTTTEPAPPADASAPVVALKLPKSRVGSKLKSIRITFRDPQSDVEFAQVNVKRRIRLSSGVVDQAYDGRTHKWHTTTSSKYRIFPKVSGHASSYTLRFPKGMSKARYWITVKAQNAPGTGRTKTFTFRTT